MRLRLCLPVLASLVLAIPLGARPQQTRPSVSETAEAVLVEVPVRVTDRKGNPIRGLAARDFELFDDGKKQEILAVDTIDLAQKSVAASAPEPIHPAARRHFLLLFDFSFAQPRSILAAQRAAKEFVLSGVADADFVAVATYSVEHGMKLLVTFSPDRVQVYRAVETLGLMPPENITDPLSLAFDIAKIKPTGSSLGTKESQAAAISETLQTMLAISRARADQYARGRIRRLAESLGDLAGMLDSVSGRKDIIYLSEGFESRLVTGTRDTELERDQIISGEQWKVDGEKRFGNSTIQGDLRMVGNLFRRSDCVLHAVDIAGLRLDPETTSVDAPSENSLFELAQPTGGEVLRNGNDFHEQFARLLTSTSLVYVLSFRPARTGQEGKFHELKVKVRVSGARVLARAGYYERLTFRMLSPLERSLLAADVVANEVPVAQVPVRVLASPLPGANGAARVPVLVEVRGPELLIGHHSPRLPVEIYVYAYDSEGSVRDFFTQMVDVDLDINRARLERGGLKYYGQLVLPSGSYRLRALVRNGETGRMGLAVEALRVPNFSEKLPYIAPPVFLESSSEGLFVRGRPGAVGRTVSQEILTLPETRAGLVPAVLPEVRSGSSAEVSVVAYYFGESRGQSLRIGAQVLSEEGRPLGDGAIRVLGQSPADPDGKQVLTVAFTPEELSPGRYSLRVFLQDAATGKAGYASAPFLVR